jgi:nucleoside-diphosphate kinase
MPETTLLIIKPDAVSRNAVGAILKRVEDREFKIRHLKMTRLTRGDATRFYAVHSGRPFFDGLIDFMTSGPVVPLALERESAVSFLREVVGVTDSAEAAEGTIRRDFGSDVQRNAVHASDSPETAAEEIAFFFGEGT